MPIFAVGQSVSQAFLEVYSFGLILYVLSVCSFVDWVEQKPRLAHLLHMITEEQ